MAGRSRGRLDARRLELLELGLRLFAARNYAEISIDEIAKAAKISRGLLYHYFRNKRGFYTETVRFACHELLERITPQLSDDPEEELRVGLSAFLEHVESYSDAYRVLLRGGLGGDDEIQEVVEQTRTLIVERILEGAPDVPAALPSDRRREVEFAVRSWLAMVEAVALRWLDAKEGPLAVSRETAISTWGAALRAMVQTVVGSADDSSAAAS